ncbi:hypothetical protein [Microcoleus sp. B7-D4]
MSLTTRRSSFLCSNPKSQAGGCYRRIDTTKAVMPVAVGSTLCGGRA